MLHMLGSAMVTLAVIWAAFFPRAVAVVLCGFLAGCVCNAFFLAP